MVIRLTNYYDKEFVSVSLPLLVGEVIGVCSSKIFVENKTLKSDCVVWPVINGKFKVLVQLIKGENIINFRHKRSSYNLTLIHEPLKCKKFVRLVYIKCKDDDGMFQAPEEEDNSFKSAQKRLGLAAQMLQTFTYDKLKDHNLKRKTFRLENADSDVWCHIFTSSLTLEEAYSLNDEQLWSHFAVELMNSKLRDGNNCKFLAFLSFTRYINNLNVQPAKYPDILQLTKGHVALGGGGLALFGTGCLHTWPECVQQIPWRFGDKRKIDRMRFMDDSANRGWYWACYSTSLGATLHELGHTFDLGHTDGGIMGRGFDDIHKYFIVDMFYHDQPFQKDHNPFYQESSILNHTVPLYITPTSDNTTLSASLKNIKFCDEESPLVPQYQSKEGLDAGSIVGKAWRVPNPPDCYSSEKSAVHVGGAYWTRSSALLLYFHKWFNDTESENSDTISRNDSTLTSPNGIRVIEFRDAEGTSLHHVEFLEGNGKCSVHLKDLDIASISEETSVVVAEDSLGNILKFKLNT